MSHVDLSAVDLNLLKAFDALAREGSVTNAAERLSIGQPAMSHALARLRELIGDDLFVKTQRGMEPTERAQALIVPIRTALLQIAHALGEPHTFDANLDATRFRIGMLDSIAAGVLPYLLMTIAASAPGVTVDVHTLEAERLATMLEDGELDLAVSLDVPVAGLQRSALLLREPYLCIFDPASVAASDPMTLDEFLAVPHIATLAPDRSTALIDRELQQLGKTRRVLASTPDFLLAGYLLHEVPAIATVPAGFAQRCRITAGLEVRRPPLPLPECEVAMTWHAREDGSVKHRWLRDTVTLAATQMADAIPRPTAIAAAG